MKLIKSIVILGLFSIFFNCNKTSSSSENDLKEITQVADSEEGFNDISLKIVSDDKTSDSHVYTAKGLFNSTVVGLKFEVKSKLPNGINSDGSLDAKNGFFQNGIKIYSIGNESDELIKAISKLYGYPSEKPFTKNVLSPTAFSLNQSKVNLDSLNYYKFKLFFNDGENDKEEDYCELFFNINTKNKTIELFEKDQEYRSQLINLLTGK